MVIEDKSNFIKTSDAETKQYLLKAGFQLLTESGGISIFLNNATLTFSDIDGHKLKITYSNMLTF